jgi:hypothetical protein
MRLAVVMAALLLAAGRVEAQPDPGSGSGSGSGSDPGSDPGSGVVPAPDQPALPADAPAVSAAASAPQATIGQVFYLFVKVVYQPGTQVNLPASLVLGPAFEETARTDSIEKNPDGTFSRHFEIALQAFEVGDLVIPPIPVTWATQGRVQEVMTQAVPIQIASYIGEGEATLRDIAGPVAVERPDYTLVWVGAVFVGAILLVVLILMTRSMWRRRRRRVLAQLPDALVRSAHDEALARLDEVEASGMLDQEDRKPAYLAMSEILRAYIGRRYGFPALDLTTEEIRRDLVARPDAAHASDLVCGWLERSDLVKFAGYDATPDEARQALYDARIFIDRTRAAPAPQPQAVAS